MQENAYENMTASEIDREEAALKKKYAEHVSQGLALNMARGKPSAAQLDLSRGMLGVPSSPEDCFSEDGTDCRNYGVLEGIPEARRLMAFMLDDKPENVLVLGNSSLTAMHDTVARCLDFGCLGSAPWSTLDTVKFLCPSPGYDRHFKILEQFGIEMIPVGMTQDGPDMDTVESLVFNDASIKGIWCVPKYANPTGITYSDETVRRLASMECAADDFRIFWDNAYCVHNLYTDPAMQDQLLDIGTACVECGTEARYFKFASTSKITFPGAGVAAFAASPENVNEAQRLLSAQMIGADKLNQLRHVRFLPNRDALQEHMAKHAAVLRPKFELVWKVLDAEMGPLGIARWTKPHGGYFVSFDGMNGTAKRTVQLAKEAGVVLTGAGATYPYGNDPHDSNIRIAPTMPTLEELEKALEIFVCCYRIAALESLKR